MDKKPGRPRVLKQGVQSSIYIDADVRDMIDQKGMSLSAFFRNFSKAHFGKLDLYKELEKLRLENIELKNKLTKNIIDNETDNDSEDIMLRLTPRDKTIIKNPDEFLRYLDLYSRNIIPYESFTAKMKMSPERALKLKEFIDERDISV